MDSIVIFGVSIPFFLVFSFLFKIAVGVYFLFTYHRICRTGKMIENEFFVPGGCSMSECKDKKKYKTYIKRVILKMGIGLLLCAILEYGGIIFLEFKGVDPMYIWISVIPTFILLFWYGWRLRFAAISYWNLDN